VTYFPCDHPGAKNAGLTWQDDKSPMDIVQRAIYLVDSRREYNAEMPDTFDDFSEVVYEEDGKTFTQAEGSVHPEKYGGSKQKDASICFKSTLPSGCQDDCRHRHKFFCLREAVTAVHKGKREFMLGWAKNRMKNKTAESNLIPRAPRPVGGQAAPALGARTGSSAAGGARRGQSSRRHRGSGRLDRPENRDLVRKAQIKAEDKKKAEDRAAYVAKHDEPLHEVKGSYTDKNGQQEKMPTVTLGKEEKKEKKEKKEKEKKEKKEEKKEEKKASGWADDDDDITVDMARAHGF
jgi:hypothetical protein